MYEPNSSAALTRIEKAKLAINQLCAFYPPPQASDTRAFIAGMVAMLSEYQEWLIELVANPARGIAASNKFFPNLAELKTWLEDHATREFQHQDLMTRYRRKDQFLLAAPDIPPPKNYAAKSGLKALYGIRDVPPGWDAVDVARAKARYGENFHAEIEKALETEGRPPPAPTIYGRVIEQARAAMEARQREAEAAE